MNIEPTKYEHEPIILTTRQEQERSIGTMRGTVGKEYSGLKDPDRVIIMTSEEVSKRI